MEAWQRDFGRLVQRKRKVLSRYSQNVMSRRIYGELGGEAEYMGFRLAILYFQLTPHLDLDRVDKLVWIMSRKMRNLVAPTRFATLFLNDQDYKLMHPRSVVSSTTAVTRIVREYFEEYSSSNEPFSRTLKQLFPRQNPYSRGQYPGKADLCVVFHDKRGITVDPDIREKVEMLSRNWIWVCVDKGTPVRISEVIPD